MHQNKKNEDILRYALKHLERERNEVIEKIIHVQGQIGQKLTTANAVPTEESTVAPQKKRVLSATARKRIGTAQKKRWEAYRKGNATAKPESKPKKYKRSAATRKRMSIAQKKRWENKAGKHVADRIGNLRSINKRAA